MTESNAPEGPDARKRLRLDLENAWRAMCGTSPSDLQPDLIRLSAWFDPNRAPAQLREAIDHVEETEPSERLLAPDPPLVVLAAGRVLVTPEGRLELERLTRGTPHQRPDQLVDYILELYRGWTSKPLQDVIDHFEGRGPNMKYVSLGVALVLLEHGAVAKSNALVLTRNESEEVVAALMAPLLALKDAGGQKEGVKAPFQGFPVSHTQPRLFRAIRHEAPKKKPVSIWIDGKRRGEVLGVVADELVRKRGFSPAKATAIVAAAIDTYNANYSTLTAAGLVRKGKKPADLRAELLHRFRRVESQGS